jgi:uncharacterized membrane protein YedE/YeeE
MAFAVPFFTGLLFGLGLCVAGMIDPGKVLGFLDLAGDWNPSLAFVMGGAVAVGLIAFRFAPGVRPDAANSRRPDAPLIAGALIFGVGWGMGGLCPGPALANLAFLDPRAIVFVMAMLAGAMACRFYERRGSGSR